MLHQKVQVVIFSKDYQQVLLLKLPEQRGSGWQNITGNVDSGEELSAAAKREVFEETGLEGELQQIDLSFTFHDRWDRDITEAVYSLKTSNDQVTLSEEHTNYKWVPINEITNESYQYPSNFEAFKKALKWEEK